MFEIRYKDSFGETITDRSYHTVDNWGKDKAFLYFRRKESTEFLIVKKDNIIHVKYEL